MSYGQPAANYGRPASFQRFQAAPAQPLAAHPIMQALQQGAGAPAMPQANPFMGAGGPAGLADPNAIHPAHLQAILAHPVMQQLMRGGNGQVAGGQANPFMPQGGGVGMVDPNAPPLTGREAPIGRI